MLIWALVSTAFWTQKLKRQTHTCVAHLWLCIWGRVINHLVMSLFSLLLWEIHQGCSRLSKLWSAHTKQPSCTAIWNSVLQLFKKSNSFFCLKNKLSPAIKVCGICQLSKAIWAHSLLPTSVLCGTRNWVTTLTFHCLGFKLNALEYAIASMEWP